MKDCKIIKPLIRPEQTTKKTADYHQQYRQNHNQLHDLKIIIFIVVMFRHWPIVVEAARFSIIHSTASQFSDHQRQLAEGEISNKHHPFPSLKLFPENPLLKTYGGCGGGVLVGRLIISSSSCVLNTKGKGKSQKKPQHFLSFRRPVPSIDVFLNLSL